MSFLFSDKVFYHIYALGLGGCSKQNDFSSAAGTFFERLSCDLDRIKSLGCNAILIGPVFESTAHGYDTLDYFYIDRRLGNNERFAHFCRLCHQKGFSIVLDAVFNHTGRHFFAFKDIQQNGANSRYKDWYTNLTFGRQSNYGDPFDYDGWAGCKDLVKLNTNNPEVRAYLFSAVEMWIKTFDIDGLRLDAADVLSKSFLSALADFCKGLKADFWLMGEVVHGNYTEWTQGAKLDSVTNYQLYKALWSSLNEHNMHELSYNVNREFGTEGLYTDSALYTFVDNHDVNRAGSVLKNPREHLCLLYALLFSLPGIPSVYYGSEYGIKGERGRWDDYDLRPTLSPFAEIDPRLRQDFDTGFLSRFIARVAKIRLEHTALQNGTWSLEYVSGGQCAFWRKSTAQEILVLVNADFCKAEVHLEKIPQGTYTDLLGGSVYSPADFKKCVLEPCSVLLLEKSA